MTSICYCCDKKIHSLFEKKAIAVMELSFLLALSFASCLLIFVSFTQKTLRFDFASDHFGGRQYCQVTV